MTYKFRKNGSIKTVSRRGLKAVAAILSFIVIFLVAVNLIPPKKSIEKNPFIVGEGNLPMIAAHRGGGENNPENTMLAFREAVNMGVDIIESDLHLTSDGELVFNHDAYIDETANTYPGKTLREVKMLCNVRANRHYIKDMTLAELLQYNFGYYFTDENGNKPYELVSDVAAAGLQIATFEQMLAEFSETNPDLLFIIEIKDSGDTGFAACAKLNEVLNQYPSYRDRIVVGTFHDEIEDELKSKYPDIMRGAPMGSAASFIITQMLGVNLFAGGDFACLQIPMSYDVGIELKLDKKTFISRAHKRNIAVQYWTINGEDEMRRLIELGSDCIMTDNPKLLKEVLEEYK